MWQSVWLLSGSSSVQTYVEIPAMQLKVNLLDVSQFLHPALEISQIRLRQFPPIYHIIQFLLLVRPLALHILTTESVVK